MCQLRQSGSDRHIQAIAGNRPAIGVQAIAGQAIGVRPAHSTFKVENAGLTPATGKEDRKLLDDVAETVMVLQGFRTKAQKRAPANAFALYLTYRSYPC